LGRSRSWRYSFVTHLLHIKTHNYSANRALLHYYTLNPPVTGDPYFSFGQSGSGLSATSCVARSASRRYAVTLLLHFMLHPKMQESPAKLALLHCYTQNPPSAGEDPHFCFSAFAISVLTRLALDRSSVPAILLPVVAKPSAVIRS
jgi:hypothetical protein